MGPFAIIGNPVRESMSPSLFRAAYAGIPEGTYTFMEVPDIAAAWKRVLENGIQGINVTMPFKTSVLDLAHVLHSPVSQIRAANLLVREKDTWTAYNTDVYGVIQSFRESGTGMAGKNALVIGAGGAGRAAAWGLQLEGAKVFMANRTVREGVLPLSGIPSLLQQCTLVVNTVPWDPGTAGSMALTSVHTVLDASYTLKPLRRDAEKTGARYVDGYCWLFHQAAAGFRIRTGLDPDRPAMRRLLGL